MTTATTKLIEESFSGVSLSPCLQKECNAHSCHYVPRRTLTAVISQIGGMLAQIFATEQSRQDHSGDLDTKNDTVARTLRLKERETKDYTVPVHEYRPSLTQRGIV